MAVRSVLSHNIIKPKSGTNTATPLILMHGLFGQKTNLHSLANSELISKSRTCYLLDLRNHGDSFHSNNMHYSVGICYTDPFNTISAIFIFCSHWLTMLCIL